MDRFSNRRVSVKDVARVAGVSQQTVSRVVNGSEQVAPITREKVLRVIEQLGYRRNEFARYLLEGRSRTFGVVFGGHDYLGGREVNSGLIAEAEARGYSLLVKEYRQGEAACGRVAFVPGLLDRQVDGMLWILSDSSTEYESVINRLVDEYDIPVVTLVMSRSQGAPYSAFDNFGAGVMATQHLIGRGRRCIAHLAGPVHSWDAQERLRGWRHAMQTAGLAGVDDLVEFGSWLPAGGEVGLRKLLERRPEIDAVFAANDNTALGAMLAAHRLGRRIPEEIAFVGVGDNRMAGWTHPPLTTIRQDQVAMGRQAVRILSELVEAKFSGLPRPKVADYLDAPQLVIRESS